MRTLNPSKEIRALTGLRGVAAALVVLFHFLASRSFSRNPANNLLLHGYLSVDLFFILSGFIMALTHKKDFVGGITRRGYMKFIGKRIARVYPAYLVATLAAFALIMAGLIRFHTGHSIVRTLVSNLLMVQTWGIDWSLDFPAWSISAEFTAYLLFPWLLAAAMFRGRIAAFLSGVLALAVIALMCRFGGFLSPHAPAAALLNFDAPTWGLPAIRCVAEFTMGLLTYRAYMTDWGKRFGLAQMPAVVIPVVLLALLCVPRTDFAVVLLLPFLILSLSRDSNAPARLLGSQPIWLSGVYSYSIYLVHGLFAPWVNHVADLLTRRGIGHAQTLGAAAGILATVAVAVLLYRYVENPGRATVREWFNAWLK